MVKKALLFGLNYITDASSNLAGCINDAKNLAQWLKTVCHYADTDILLCTDETPVKPTRVVMLALLRELCLFTHRFAVEQVFIAYSGHGTQVQDENHDERDALDSALVPLDFRTQGLIIDDDIATILSQFHPRTDVILLIDACHSGTICDLPFLYQAGDKWAVENNVSMPARIMMISGCMDTQTAGETQNQGVMTRALLQVLATHKNDVTCFKLLKYLQDQISAWGYTQRPQLSTTRALSETCVFICAAQQSRPFMTAL